MSARSVHRHTARRPAVVALLVALLLGAGPAAGLAEGGRAQGGGAEGGGAEGAGAEGGGRVGAGRGGERGDGGRGGASGSVDERVVLDSGRAYVLHVPAELRRRPQLIAGRPVLVFLHALLSDPADAAQSTRFDALANRDGVLVAYPNGLKRSFNAGLCCGEASASEVDDVTFLADVVADLRRRGAGRISVVGFSNGGMMAYRFACARPDLVDTVGVMSGTLEVPRCAGRIRALHLHGERDTAVPFDGTAWSPRLSAFLRSVPSIPDAAPGSAITVRQLPGYGHRWTVPTDPVDATAEFWRFARMSERP